MPLIDRLIDCAVGRKKKQCRTERNEQRHLTKPTQRLIHSLCGNRQSSEQNNNKRQKMRMNGSGTVKGREGKGSEEKGKEGRGFFCATHMKGREGQKGNGRWDGMGWVMGEGM